MAQMRPEECANSLRAFRAIPAPELARALSTCDRSQRREVGRLLGCRLQASGRVSETQARLIRTGVQRASSSTKVTDALDILTARVRERTLAILGDDFDDPNGEAIEALVAELRDEFDDDLVRLYLALVVDAGAVASPLVAPYLADAGPLSIPPTSAVDVVPPRRRSTTEERRAGRAERRRAKTLDKSERREQREIALRVRRPRRSQPSAVSDGDEATAGTSTESVTIEQTRLLHPHISRFKSVSADSAHRGMVGTAFIPFSGRDGKEGKVRPCVVVAAGRKHALLRPLYSFARRPAGGWRAVELREWEAAGLEHRSWVGDELHVVRWRRFARIGALTTSDWNRICRGEVN
jgi:hypothetical protein